LEDQRRRDEAARLENEQKAAEKAARLKMEQEQELKRLSSEAQIDKRMHLPEIPRSQSPVVIQSRQALSNSPPVPSVLKKIKSGNYIVPESNPSKHQNAPTALINKIEHNQQNWSSQAKAPLPRAQSSHETHAVLEQLAAIQRELEHEDRKIRTDLRMHASSLRSDPYSTTRATVTLEEPQRVDRSSYNKIEASNSNMYEKTKPILFDMNSRDEKYIPLDLDRVKNAFDSKSANLYI
jgi:hypothetical protein